MAKNILNLETLNPERLQITIDGKAYEINAVEDLGIEPMLQVQDLHRRYIDLVTIGATPGHEYTVEEGAAISLAMDQMCRILIRDCSEEVHARLQDNHRIAILSAFKEATGQSLPPVQPPAPNRAARRSIGVKPSPRSSASTAASPTAGSE
ncbi:MAG: hypothetical protein GEU75_10410 [Dehalococcoidia bacterium]|nr:hypothetical protein [Dehalococcoidia bacterium]